MPTSRHPHPRLSPRRLAVAVAIATCAFATMLNGPGSLSADTPTGIDPALNAASTASVAAPSGASMAPVVRDASAEQGDLVAGSAAIHPPAIAGRAAKAGRSAARSAADTAAARAWLARTPPMGFNTWNAFGCHVTERNVRAIARILVSSGLRDKGYRYVNLDDCWGAAHRDADGKLRSNPDRFPSGMRALGKYLHARGLKFGIYSSAGTHTCNKLGFPGALGHEQADAAQFAYWRVDYLKYDNCNHQGVPQLQRYKAMQRALDHTGRAIIYAICQWGKNEPWTWAPKIGNLWRTGRDIHDDWGSIITTIRINERLARYARPGHWNDPDLLEVGNSRGLSATEQRTQLSLWAMMAAPLLISTDLRHASAETISMLGNRGIIALDQDRLGRQATVVHSAAGLTSYVKVLAHGDRGVALFNATAKPHFVATTARAAGIRKAPSYRLTDLWAGVSHSSKGLIRVWVPAHGTVVYRVHPRSR